MAEDADLAFEHSSVKATIKSPVHSVKILVREVLLPKVSEQSFWTKILNHQQIAN